MNTARIQRRRFVLGGCAATAAAALGAPLHAFAQPSAWPTRPIRLIVSFSTGSGNDTIARELAIAMTQSLGQSVVVENRGGGGGVIGTEAVAKAAPDGYTIGLGTSSQLVMNVGLYRSLPFDVEKDLHTIGLVSRTPLVLVASADMPGTLKELIALAKAKPGQISYGSGGPGSISHIVGEAFAKAAGVQLLHVPYKGNGAALVDLSGGHVKLLFDGLISTAPLARQGKLKMLAISGDKRSPMAPTLPTFAEQDLRDYEAYTWNSLMAPAGTPPEVLAKLNTALNQALALPAVQTRLAQGASDPLGPTTAAQAEAYGRAERVRWVPFIRSLRIDNP